MSETAAGKPSRWSKMNKTSLLRTVGTLISIALLIDLLLQQGWEQIMVVIRQIPPWRLVLALGLMIISRFAVAARWHVLLRSADVPEKDPLTFRQTLRVTFAGLFASNFLPTTVGGDLVRFAGIIQLGYDAAVGAASLIADRLVGMAGMAMVVPLSFPVLLSTDWAGVQTGFSNQPGRWQPGLAVSVLGRWTNKFWSFSRNAFQRIYEALKFWLKQPRALLASFGYTWINMLCLFGVLSLIVNSQGQAMPFWLIGGLYSLVYFVTLIPISINGYGLQEFSMTIIFSNLGRASISEGLAAALLFRTIMMLVSLPGALFVPDILASRRKSTSDDAGAPAESEGTTGS
jgi:glycosyltransferase 2 family protein